MQEEQELEALENEVSQAQSSLESDCAKAIAQKITPELEELFFEDKEAFLKQIFIFQNEFLEQNIAPKLQKAKDLEGKIAQKRDFETIESAKAQFLQNNPECDFEELMKFYTTLSEQEQASLGTLPPLEFFTKLYEIFKQKQEAPKEQDIPKQLDGVEGSTLVGGGETLPMERF